MKLDNVSTNNTIKANPTKRLMNEIYEVIKKAEMPMSTTAIAKQSGKGLYATKQSIEFLEKFGIVKTITSSGNQTMVFLVNGGENATTITA